MADYFLSIYKPVCGWKAVIYGPEGPQETSFYAYNTPQEALKAARQWASEVGLRCKVQDSDIERCETCNDWALNGYCAKCSAIALRKSIEEAGLSRW